MVLVSLYLITLSTLNKLTTNFNIFSRILASSKHQVENKVRLAHLPPPLPGMVVHSSLLADPAMEIPELRPWLIEHLGSVSTIANGIAMVALNTTLLLLSLAYLKMYRLL